MKQERGEHLLNIVLPYIAKYLALHSSLHPDI
jgi:hypothetical protein